MERYFGHLDSLVDRAYEVATRARKTGLDPELAPEIPRAEDMAMRVEKLLGHLGVDGIAQEIRTLSQDLPRDEVALTMARRIATDTSRDVSVAGRLDAALRVGLAILTEGILVAPLEGLAEVHLIPGGGPTESVELYYAGPIRAAGGTAQALSVLLADVVRRDLGLAPFVPDAAEVERYKEEIPLYKHLQHLQYVPSATEIDLVVRNVPVCISGEATEGDAEVSAFRDLPRVPTNGVRGGACLVIAEGLCQKAAKLRKVVEKLGLTGWEFLAQVGQAKNSNGEASRGPKYLAEAVGGRPVLAYPNRPGGFRLTYGRCRTSGLAAYAVNPATMVLVRSFVAVGTQLKVEFPGKATAMAVCDSIEGPIVELDDGQVIAVHDVARAREVVSRVRRIVDLGQMLVGVGEFLENNRPLVPGAYTLDWHFEELRAAGASTGPGDIRPGYAEAVSTSREYGVPLHPRFLLFWHDLSSNEIAELSRFVEGQGRWSDGHLVISAIPRFRELLVRLGFLFRPTSDERWVGEQTESAALAGGLGLGVAGSQLVRVTSLDPVDPNPLVFVTRLAGATVMPRAPTRVGARVGRPEKARQRKMSPNVHTLFPVGEAGGPTRSVMVAARETLQEGVSTQLGVRECPACGKKTVWLRCTCGVHTEATGATVTESLPIAPLWAAALRHLHLRRVPEVKGVKGLISSGKVPEVLEKGILRATHGISVYQDGTARFDLTDLPLTHFRPAEVGLGVDQARKLGYDVDWAGAHLEDSNQLVELKPQDLIVSRSCGTYLTHLAQFVDDELVRLYETEPFFRAQVPEDLLGQIVVALAPHTSGGVVGRLVGYTEAEACFAHPVFHAAKRRNCDGDEDSVTLLLDALLNFSRAYLPDSRGALMDKPLVLTTRLHLSEVDQEAHNLEIGTRYPLALYRAAAEGRSGRDLEGAVEILGQRLGDPEPFVGLGFTHDTTNLAEGPARSAYRDAGSMNHIVEQSLLLTTQLRSVDIADAVTLVLNSHFLPDLMGNLKSYATQKFRCKSCGASYRRLPLTGRCARATARGPPCDGELLPTVYEGAVRKYLGLSQRLAATGGVPPYLRQRVQLLESSLETLFPGSRAQTTLESFRIADEADGASPASDAPSTVGPP